MMDSGKPALTSRRFWLAALAVVGCVAGFVSAQAERVVFQDLRVLVVDRVEEKEGFLILHFGGGNSMTVATSQIYQVLPDIEQDQPATKKTEKPWRKVAGAFANDIENAAKLHELEPELILAVAQVESGMNPKALSPKGAMGLMQLMPGTADVLSVSDPHNPRQNLEAGAKWLKKMLVTFEGNLDLALAAYNAGENAVRRFGGVPPFAETEIYIERVRDRLDRLKVPS